MRALESSDCRTQAEVISSVPLSKPSCLDALSPQALIITRLGVEACLRAMVWNLGGM